VLSQSGVLERTYDPATYRLEHLSFTSTASERQLDPLRDRFAEIRRRRDKLAEDVVLGR